MIGNVSDWLSYAGGALIKVADSAGSTVLHKYPCHTILTAIYHGGNTIGVTIVRFVSRRTVSHVYKYKKNLKEVQN